MTRRAAYWKLITEADAVGGGKAEFEQSYTPPSEMILWRAGSGARRVINDIHTYIRVTYTH